MQTIFEKLGGTYHWEARYARKDKFFCQKKSHKRGLFCKNSVHFHHIYHLENLFTTLRFFHMFILGQMAITKYLTHAEKTAPTLGHIVKGGDYYAHNTNLSVS